jgi:hypothetical protein
MIQRAQMSLLIRGFHDRISSIRCLTIGTYFPSKEIHNSKQSTDLFVRRGCVRNRCLSGDAFDKAYMRAMVEDQQEDVSELRRESQSAKDPDVGQFAPKTLPTLEEHLRVAQNTNPQWR